jgi:murein DD-endopeptidase MepM/ murein hydrolase activator NlpD
MSLTKYIYNRKTLRYEPAPLHWPSIILTLFGVLVCGFLFFVAMVWLQNRLVETPAERALTSENNTLVHYKAQLETQLDDANTQLNALEETDKNLYEKIFEAKRAEKKEHKVNKELLLADGPAFQEVMGSLLSKSSELLSSSQTRNQYFSENASVKKDDISVLSSLPSCAPLANFDASNVVSGYGMRINPFHKGLYHHEGIDLAAPRDTEVLSAGKGTVIQVNYSELQAGYGNYLIVDHGNGYVTQYANLGSIKVFYGQRIAKGDPIATIGISGGSIAPHVHFEVLKDGKNVDPVKFIMHGISADLYESIWTASQKQNQSLD